ncbi:MAG TPA: hypothetical protein VEW67_06970 [Thermoleophilaceae bacterium]|nr:hypothetical protein [Thermoleophilaceae bacterium]
MLKSMLKARAAKRGARMLPGGWITLAALHPRSRRIGAAAARRGWREIQKHRGH